MQLVKENSIQGCKLNNLDIVYTPAANLKKTAAMDVGQVSMHAKGWSAVHASIPART